MLLAPNARPPKLPLDPKNMVGPVSLLLGQLPACPAPSDVPLLPRVGWVGWVAPRHRRTRRGRTGTDPPPALPDRGNHASSGTGATLPCAWHVAGQCWGARQLGTADAVNSGSGPRWIPHYLTPHRRMGAALASHAPARKPASSAGTVPHHWCTDDPRGCGISNRCLGASASTAVVPAVSANSIVNMSIGQCGPGSRTIALAGPRHPSQWSALRQPRRPASWARGAQC